MVGDRLHQVAEEIPPGQGVQAGHGLVEEEQLRSLGERDGQRELGALPAGERSRLLLAVQAELVDPPLSELASQPGFSLAPMVRWSATRRRA